MKTISVFLLVIFVQDIVLGQDKNNIYTDGAFFSPGGSVTYDRKEGKYFDMGLGASYYNFNGVLYHNIRFATYLDFRHCRGRKRNRFFYMADVGMMFYSGRIPAPAEGSLAPNSPFAASGIGYCYCINKRGMGPYISLGLDGSWIEGFDHIAYTPEGRHYDFIDIEGVLSIGFKF